MPTIPKILHCCSEAERATLVRSLPLPAMLALNLAFAEWAHGGQVAPAGDWRTWVLMAGRGFGKTRAGAEWVLERCGPHSPPPFRGGAFEAAHRTGDNPHLPGAFLAAVESALRRHADGARGDRRGAVSATRGKVRRAEPVVGLFESGKARLAGRFPELEDQLGGMVAGGDYEGPDRSPDRADAMVWALWALLIANRPEPRVHSL